MKYPIWYYAIPIIIIIVMILYSIFYDIQFWYYGFIITVVIALLMLWLENR